MPRVNRDLERRLAARRQRQSRRVAGSGAPRYRLGDRATAAPDEARSQGHWTEATAAAAPEQPRARGAPRAAARPFSDYGKEYAYVVSDLRRIAMVVGGLMAFVVGLAAILRA